jgi:hypothetical protein
MNVNKDIKYRDVEDTIHYKRGKNYYVGAEISAYH